MVKSSNTEIDLAPYIDHTLLNQTATPEQIQQCCYEAERYKFASVCVFPSYVQLAKELLQGKSPNFSTVIGFPT
ncbi:MAG: 2-deoxyribose-5-phosphate aldolase, partial [Planktothrix sp.]